MEHDQLNTKAVWKMNNAEKREIFLVKKTKKSFLLDKFKEYPRSVMRPIVKKILLLS